MEHNRQDKEPIGAVLARVVEDGRALVKAELALARTDFYRRLGRARTGAALLLVGAIMGQAAAVTFLVTLSFVLTPWVGRLGGAAISVALGVAVALFAIRAGVRKLVLVVEDPEDEELADAAKLTSPIDELFEKVRQKAHGARNQLVETVGEAQARLHPQALIADIADILVDHAQRATNSAIDTVRRRPVRSAAAAIVLSFVLLRLPLHKLLLRLAGATARASASYQSPDLSDSGAGRSKE